MIINAPMVARDKVNLPLLLLLLLLLPVLLSSSSLLLMVIVVVLLLLKFLQLKLFTGQYILF